MNKKILAFVILMIGAVIGLINYSSTINTCPSNLQKDKTYIGNAGCFIYKNGKILVVKQAETGKLNFPGGTAEENESAKCTAYRETEEEAGIKAEVKELFYESITPPFYLFNCEIKGNQKPKPQENFKHEVSEAIWVDIEKTTPKEWRFPKQVDVIKQQIREQKK